jgi:hypothetical protein
MTETPPNFFADYEPADLTGASLALVRAAVEHDFGMLAELTRSLEPNLLVGALLGPLIALAERMHGSREEMLAWLLATHEATRGRLAD